MGHCCSHMAPVAPTEDDNKEKQQAMDFKKFAADAGTFLNRAKQFTEEKLGQAEKTELDAHFENLLQRADKTKLWTEKVLKATEAVLDPNPNSNHAPQPLNGRSGNFTTRVESYFYEKFEQKKRDRITNTEFLGQEMISAGNEFGPGTSYGTALIKVGTTEQKLGVAEKEFISATANNFLQPLQAFLEGDMKTLQPLQAFLDGDMKTLQKERKVLDLKRLDLDACKTRLRRAKSIGQKDVSQDQIIADAEAELRVAQSEFDRQAEITKLLLEGVSSTHAHHLRCLHDFVEAQTNYYAQCQQHMADLQRQLGSFSATSLNHTGANNTTSSSGGNTQPPSSNYSTVDTHNSMGSGLHSLTNSTPSAPPQQSSGAEQTRTAKVLYDYDAADQTELSLCADEVISVRTIAGSTDWVMGERGSQYGRVPLTYLQVLG